MPERPVQTNPAWRQAPSVALCVETCHAACCRAPGSLTLSQAEAERMAMRTHAPLVLYEEGWNLHRLNFSDHDGHCQMLEADSRCRIYSDRPVVCHRFPSQPDPRCAVWPMEPA